MVEHVSSICKAVISILRTRETERGREKQTKKETVSENSSIITIGDYIIMWGEKF